MVYSPKVPLEINRGVTALTKLKKRYVPGDHYSFVRGINSIKIKLDKSLVKSNGYIVHKI